MNTSFFPIPVNGPTDIPQDADDFPNFFGTSAAAPHAAAIAALLLEASQKNLSPGEIRELLKGYMEYIQHPLQ